MYIAFAKEGTRIWSHEFLETLSVDDKRIVYTLPEKQKLIILDDKHFTDTGMYVEICYGDDGEYYVNYRSKEHMPKNKNSIVRCYMQEPFYTLTASGIKKVEGALRKDELGWVEVNDIIEWYTNKFHKENYERRYTLVRVTKLTRYESIEEYLEKQELNNPMLGFTSMKDKVHAINKWFYTNEDVKNHELVAIEYEKVITQN